MAKIFNPFIQLQTRFGTGPTASVIMSPLFAFLLHRFSYFLGSIPMFFSWIIFFLFICGLLQRRYFTIWQIFLFFLPRSNLRFDYWLFFFLYVTFWYFLCYIDMHDFTRFPYILRAIFKNQFPPFGHYMIDDFISDNSLL